MHRRTVVLNSQQQNLKSQAQVAAGPGAALRFTGSGTANVNRVNIALDNPERPVDVGATDFTIEWWMQVNPGDITNSGACRSGSYNWVNGDIIVDRDTDSAGDFGDFGISLYGGGIAFGVGRGSTDNTICGTTNLADGQWHHLAVTRASATGQMSIYVNGVLNGQGTGPAGDISYRNNRSGNTWDPYLVLGAEKHNYVRPLFRGTMDELRISNTLRYTAAFARPSAAFIPDGNTVALYNFNEGAGTTVNDLATAAGGPSTGTIAVGGSPEGPVWVTSTAPITGDPNATPMPTTEPLPTSTPTVTTIPGAQAPAAAAYGFDEGSGTLANDSSGSGLNGTVTNAPWIAAGRYGSALSFNGTTGRVSAANVTLGGPFTLMAWVNNPANTAYETIMTIGSNRDVFLSNGMLAFYDGSNEWRFGSALSNNVWHHVAIVYDGTRISGFVDGAVQGTPQSVLLGSITGRYQVGAWVEGTNNFDFFSGFIDETRIYRQALSQAQIQTAMSAPYSGGSVSTPTPTIFQPPTVTPTPALPTATPTPTPPTETFTLNPVADAYVDNTSTTTRATNYGTLTVMNVDSSPLNVGYLRFDLTPLAGRTIVSATLRVRTSTDTSSNQQRVKSVSSTTWGETTITYNNRPAVTNTVLGTINSNNAQNAWQQVNLTSTVTANVGRPFSLAIDSGGNNNIWFWTRESTSSPELVIQAR